MSDKRVIVVGVEDSATAGVVAVAAARVAMEHDATDVIFLHAQGGHSMATGLFSTVGAPPPVVETEDEGKTVLSLAGQAFRAEYAALDRPLPSVREELATGNPKNAIEDVASRAGASAIVIGARRPHAFGRIVHPDVRAAIESHVNIPVHVAALQGDDQEVRDKVGP